MIGEIIIDLDIKQIKKIAYYNKNFFHEGQKLSFYDYGGKYLHDVLINKFIVHYKRKPREPYLVVNYFDNTKEGK